ncbi:MAG TPA: MBG domain-containing protein, partial [Mucilaginibacter sp.]|nr:MBG domain-containing protein [Mucilaginibacter sp.]
TVSKPGYDNLVLHATLTISKAAQTITFPAIPANTYGDADFTIAATSTNNTIPITYSSSNTAVATISGNTVHITGAGTVTITASQAGDANHTAAADVQQTLTVNKGTITGVTFADASYSYDGTAKSLSVSGLPDGATVAYSGNGHTGAGSYAVTATVSKANYNDLVLHATLTISNSAITGVTFADAAYSYDGTAKSLSVAGLPDGARVSYRGNGHTGAGSYAVTATVSKPGYDNLVLHATLTISKAVLTVTAANATRVYGTANPAFTVSYSGFVHNETAASLTTGATATTAATKASDAGTYAITPGGAASGNYSFNYISGKLTITPATRTLTFDPLADKTYGDADFDAGASVSSGETVIYSGYNPSVVAIVNGKIHITGAGTTAITATVAASGNYSNTPSQSRTLTVNKADQTISFSLIPSQLKGSTYDLSQSVTASSGLPVTFSSSDEVVATVSGTMLSALHLGTATITASQSGNANYNAAVTVTGTVRVTDASGAEIIVHPGVTPNGDGIEDFLYIEGIRNYPQNEVTIVNRNGVTIWQGTNYDNSGHVFDGHSNITGVLQQGGTYFYKVEYTVNGERRQKTGYIVLKY